MIRRRFVALFGVAVLLAVTHPLESQRPQKAGIGFLTGGNAGVRV